MGYIHSRLSFIQRDNGVDNEYINHNNKNSGATDRGRDWHRTTNAKFPGDQSGY